MPINTECCIPKGYYATLSGMTQCSCQTVLPIGSVKSARVSRTGIVLDNTYAIPTGIGTRFPPLIAFGNLIIGVAASPVTNFPEVRLWSGNTTCAGTDNGGSIWTWIMSIQKLQTGSLLSNSIPYSFSKGRYAFNLGTLPGFGAYLRAFETELIGVSVTPQTVSNLLTCTDTFGASNAPSLFEGGTVEVEGVFGQVELATASVSLSKIAQDFTINFTCKPGADSRWVAAQGSGLFNFQYAGPQSQPDWLHPLTALVGDGADDMSGNWQQSITYHVDANPSVARTGLRAGYVYINDKYFMVEQAAGP